VRPTFDHFPQENAAFRDVARALSFVRDSAVLIETFDGLTETCENLGDVADLAGWRQRLTAQPTEATGKKGLEDLLSESREAMAAARQRAADWNLRAEGFDTMAGGLARNYRQARKAMASARKSGSAEAFHDWRKSVKYHWYHCGLLAPIWPSVMKAHRDAADRLGETLGAHHDLEVFRQGLAAKARDLSASKDLDALLDAVERRRLALEAEILPLGARLLAEPPKNLTSRWRSYWEIWQAEEAAVD
jgi:CHAD domain-containing protein